jgi:hypothetical protein
MPFHKHTHPIFPGPNRPHVLGSLRSLSLKERPAWRPLYFRHDTFTTLPVVSQENLSTSGHRSPALLLKERAVEVGSLFFIIGGRAVPAVTGPSRLLKGVAQLRVGPSKDGNNLMALAVQPEPVPEATKVVQAVWCWILQV